MLNYYALLGLNFNANAEEIKAAFKRLAKSYHPDRNPENPDAEAQFKLINEAYQTLSDPFRKGMYDMELLAFVQNLKAQQALADYQKAQARPTQAYQNQDSAQSSPQERKWERKASLYTLLGFIFIFGLSWFLHHYIPRWASQHKLTQARYWYYEKQDPLEAVKCISDANYYLEDNAEADYLFALILQQHYKDYKNAIAYYTRAIAHSENSSQKSVYYQERAFCYVQLRLFKDAATNYDFAIRHAPNKVELLLTLADLYLQKLHEYEKAQHYYERAISKAKDDPAPLIGKLVSLLKQKKYEEMLPLFLQIEKLPTPEPALYYYKGFYFYEHQMNHDQACFYWAKARQMGYQAAERPYQSTCMDRE
ncbi:DnaJ domain-containing protein [Hugenholtzia roseola]|uniref:DnaJ domain-containing protein n=1 Tax=Hugenholtzia roseola TaxID=1002 RepID=UPI0004011A7D|nr:tetratricopeptide repeat protein [Hugenholtzia roseola]